LAGAEPGRPKDLKSALGTNWRKCHYSPTAYSKGDWSLDVFVKVDPHPRGEATHAILELGRDRSKTFWVVLDLTTEEVEEGVENFIGRVLCVDTRSHRRFR
jgi:hypothetical protein